MAILRKELDIFPRDLLAGETPKGEGREWSVFYTKVRQEKSLARELLAREIPFYLPLIQRNHLYQGRKRSSYVPLFAGYVFLFATADERVTALSTNRVARVIEVQDAEELFADLRQIQLLIAANVPLTIESRIEPGRRIRVRDGALAGLEGVVQSRTKRTKLVVLINLLQQGVSLEVEDFLLDPID
ncbi:MAG: transcription termination/antitermination protein NusG [Planctomycetaceae bacterium]